jgi:hypothetical protein
MLTAVLRTDKDGGRRCRRHRALYSLINTLPGQRRRSLPLLDALFKALLQAQTGEDDAALLPWRLKDI